MRTLWMFHRRFIVAAALTVALATSAGVVLVGSRHNTAAVSSPAPSGSDNGPTRSKRPATTTSHRRPPKTNVEPPATAIERQVDTELAQAETPSAVAAAEAADVPAPATSAAYPSIPVADRSDPTAYAIAFATEILDINYAAQTRAELLAWAEHEEAPNTLPGVPASVAGKSLVLSLADPGLPGGTPSPTPSASQWATRRRGGCDPERGQRRGRGGSRLGPDHRRGLATP